MENSSWGLNLFVLFEQQHVSVKWLHSSWGLNLFVLFEPELDNLKAENVLEDWIYLYYLNPERL